MSLQIIVMAPTSACFKSTPCGNGFEGASHDCVDGAAHGTTTLTGPPLVMMLTLVPMVWQRSWQPPVVTELMLPFVAMLLMAPPMAQQCWLWLLLDDNSHGNGVDGSPRGVMASTVPLVALELMVLPVEQWHWQPSLWLYGVHNPPWQQCQWCSPFLLASMAPPMAWWHQSSFDNGVDSAPHGNQVGGAPCGKEGKGTLATRGGRALQRLMKKNFGNFCFVVFCEIFL